MSMLFSLLLAGAELPDLDRGFLKARVQRTLQEERAPVPAKHDPEAGARKLLTSDLSVIASVCGAATRTSNSVGFLAKITNAYGMSVEEKRALNTKCALFSMGLAEGGKRQHVIGRAR